MAAFNLAHVELIVQEILPGNSHNQTATLGYLCEGDSQ